MGKLDNEENQSEQVHSRGWNGEQSGWTKSIKHSERQQNTSPND